MKKLFIILGVVITMHTHAQSSYDNGLFQKILKQFASEKRLSCHYSVRRAHSNGTIDTISGTMVNTGEMAWNENREISTFQTDNWYYKADHSNKTIVICNMHKIRKPGAKAVQQYTDMVQAMSDSTVVRHSKITMKKTGNIELIDIVFDKGVLVRNIKIQYDLVRNKPVSYFISLNRTDFVNPVTYEPSYLTENIDCTMFSTDVKTLDERQFFTVAGSTITLNRYRNYKVKKQL